jgi:carbon-monoxide dehydrogenase small subunit
LNGQRLTLIANPSDSLADLLRDTLDMTATRIGCNEGVCGACTVLLNGKSVRACMTLGGQADGSELHTVEGYDVWPLRRNLQRSFVEQFAAQCGFCTSGMLAVAAEFLEDDTIEDHTDETLIRKRLSSVICRCTGYRNIVAAIAQVARQRKELSSHG